MLTYFSKVNFSQCASTPFICKLSNILKSANQKSIIVLEGAGISVAAGIPDFRTPLTGLYSKLGHLNLPNPESIFDIEYFSENPLPFYQIAHTLIPSSKIIPTPAHYFSKHLQDLGLLKRLYTQNIDGLEHQAGISEDLLVEAHGNFRNAHCIKCSRDYPISDFIKRINKFKTKNGTKPLFCKCGGLIKPDVVFFGESLPERFFKLSEIDFSNDTKAIIVMGTSLQVQPFASLISYAASNTPVFLLNKESVEGFEKEKNHFFIKGDVQESINLVSNILGWKHK